MAAPHDFDFELGTWSTQLSLLPAPLTGSTEWVKGQGTSVVRPIWGGGANLVELTAELPFGQLHALSLRLFDPATEEWSLNVATARGGTMSLPLVGGFVDGMGEFTGREDMDGRPVLVRFLITPEAPDRIRFEQAFSPDDGATWETNWIAVDTRVPDEN